MLKALIQILPFFLATLTLLGLIQQGFRFFNMIHKILMKKIIRVMMSLR